MMSTFDATLQRYRLPLQPAPERVRAAVAAGVRAVEAVSLSEATRVLAGAVPCPDEVVRDTHGRVRITCSTDLPGVTPAMVDWWFGWHLPAAERYRLWHPLAHMNARVRDARASLPPTREGDRQRYVGNVSLVDEYIGASLKKLAIAFVDPMAFGLDVAVLGAGTAVCATTTDRVLGGQGGALVHVVLPTPQGAQMRSGFWLGEIRHTLPLVQGLLGGVLNSSMMRRVIVPDRMALDLLLHCGEEMNHLARFLPRLYADIRGAEVSAAA